MYQIGVLKFYIYMFIYIKFLKVLRKGFDRARAIERSWPDACGAGEGFVLYGEGVNLGVKRNY